ncbi:hypothetical protein CBR_g38472 [Chara braunii]|uniref:Thioredoxin domain-containing protein n=1 Tax=Chara braunii TaxID=69332 RepID=A0A388JNT2_CHABU|nr:hypothetical protein CBR_g38472 [Chara braunii]|eukprot:GBG59447.1 hypothetical protein CBR_g38472 [Chara braunii]
MAVAGNCKIQWFARAEETANNVAGSRWSRGAVDSDTGVVAGIISSGGRGCGPRNAAQHDCALKLRGRLHQILFNGAHVCAAAAAVAGECICWDPCRLNFDHNRYGRTTAGRCFGHRTVQTPASSASSAASSASSAASSASTRLWRADTDTSTRRYSVSSTYCGSAFRAFSAGAFPLRSACGRRIEFSAGFGVAGNVLGANGFVGLPSQAVRSRHCRRRRYGAWSQERPQPVRQKERSAAAIEKGAEEENDGIASSRSWKVEALQRSDDDTCKEESDAQKPLILLPISSVEEFEAALAEGQQSKRAVIIEWMAQWCRKCIYLKPKLEKLALEYSK